MMADINAVGGLAISDAVPTFNGGSSIPNFDAKNQTITCNNLGTSRVPTDRAPTKDVDSPSINKEAPSNDGMNHCLYGGYSNS